MNILRFLVTFTVIMAALLFVNAGVLYLTAPSNTGNIARAHKIFTNTVIGLIIVLAGYLLIDTVMRALYAEGDWGPWNEFVCRNDDGSRVHCVDKLGAIPIGSGPIHPPDSPPSYPTPDCNNPASLAQRFGTVYPAQNAPGLQAMMNCYLADPGVQAAKDNQPLYTYDQSHPTCNYTNGAPLCEKCSHSQNSCHYGRGTGAGAMAFDINGPDEKKLFEAVKAARAKCGGRIGQEASHTHISLSSCPQ